MKVLTTAAEISGELVRLIHECSSCQMAIAWASVGFEAFRVLVANTQKIGKLIIGIHFYQTHPHFIETFLESLRVRFIMNPDGVFHPKAYFFEIAPDSWELLIGSPNFTQAGTGANDEMAILVSSRDDGAHMALDAVQRAINDYWQKASALSRADWERYREIWNRKQANIEKLQERIGLPEQREVNPNALIATQHESRSANAIFSDAILTVLGQYGPVTTREMYPYIKQRQPDLCNDHIPRLWRGQYQCPLWKHLVRTAQQNMLKRRQAPIKRDKGTGQWMKRS